MALPSVNWGAIKDVFTDAITEFGVPGVFVLKDATTFTIQCLGGFPPPAGGVENITAGMQQYQHRIRVGYEAWHAGAGVGRAPEKGDQVTVAGRRQAIETALPVWVGTNVCLGYVLTLRG